MHSAHLRRCLAQTATAAVLLALLQACSVRPAGPPSVLIVPLDTLRADHVGAYGYAAARTPVLDGLAARGARFANATTTTPLTLAAHTSLFTGTFPAYHGVRDNTGFHVDDSLTTMAEVFAGKGYRTGGFVGAFVLDRRWGIAQGFTDYLDAFNLSADVGPGLDSIQRRGDEVVTHALAWLGKDDTQPFFGWVHLYDPHAPYEAPAEFASRFPAGQIGAYDAEIAYTDSQVGRLVQALESSGRLENTLIVVLSDHGEQLGEHHEQAHGFFVYDASVQIPLLIAGPGVSSRVVPDQVRIVDVMPTVLDLAGVKGPDVMQGTTLRPALDGGKVDLLALSESWYPRFHYGWSELTAVRDGRFKFILAPRRELYDLTTDPGELTNIAAASQARADAMERSLRALLSRTTRADAATGPAAVAPDVEQKLRALGYVGGGSAKNLEARSRRDPKDAIDLYNLLKLAGSDSEAGRYDDAAAKVRQALAVDPDIIDAHAQLGNIYSKAGRPAEAVAAYRQALALDADHAMATYNLALAYRALGRIDDAILGFERSAQLEPRSGRADFQLGDIYMQRGDTAKAAAVLQHGLTLDIDRPPFLVKLGEAFLTLQRLDDAEKVLKEAVSIRADVPRGQYNLALVREQRGDTAGARAAYEAEVAANPKNYGAQFNLGKRLLEERRLPDAIARLGAAVEAKPDFAEGYLYLAKALLDRGDLAGATAAAKKGLTLKPERGIAPLGHYVLADIYNRQGRDNEAAREVALAERLERQR